MTILSLKRGTAAAQEVITLVAGNKPAVIFIRACMVGSLLVMVLISAYEVLPGAWATVVGHHLDLLIGAVAYPIPRQGVSDQCLPGAYPGYTRS